MYGLMLLRERLSEVLVTEHLGWSKLPSDGVKMAWASELLKRFLFESLIFT